jgi:hypothetical protein
MSGLFSDISTEAKGAWQTIADYFPLMRGEFTKITDINKEGNKNTFNNFCICSESIPDSLKAIISKNISFKTLSTIAAIVSNVAESDADEAINWFNKRLANTDIDSKVQNYMDSVVGSTIYESASELGLNVTTLNEAVPHRDIKNTLKNTQLVRDTSSYVSKASDNELQNTAMINDTELSRLNAIPNNRKTARDYHDINTYTMSNRMINNELERRQAEAEGAATEQERIRRRDDDTNYNYNQQMRNTRSDVSFLQKTAVPRIKTAQEVHHPAKDYFLGATKLIMSIPVVNKKTGTRTDINLLANIRTMLVDVEQTKLLPVIGDLKQRDNFYNYLRWRAGGASFARDFILNLDEIDKDVHRNTSMNLRDRILADMIKTSGVTAPRFWGKLAETRYFTLVLDKSDVQILREKYRIDIENQSGLNRVFNNLRLLSLVIVNQDRSELTFYDSDNPRNLNVISYKAAVSDDDYLKRFIMSRT